MKKYAKFITAAIGGAVAVVAILWPGDSQAQQVHSVVIAVATAQGVYAVTNKAVGSR